MTKRDAIELFKDVKTLASAIGVTRHAIYMWPEVLPQYKEDQVIGGAVRLGLIKTINQTENAA